MSLIGKGRRRKLIPLGRKTFSRRIGNSFVSAGFGRYGPYALVRKNINRSTGVKASIGTRGVEMGADSRISRKIRIGAGYNLTTKKTYAELKYKKRRLRI